MLACSVMTRNLIFPVVILQNFGQIDFFRRAGLQLVRSHRHFAPDEAHSDES